MTIYEIQQELVSSDFEITVENAPTGIDDLNTSTFYKEDVVEKLSELGFSQEGKESNYNPMFVTYYVKEDIRAVLTEMGSNLTLKLGKRCIV